MAELVPESAKFIPASARFVQVNNTRQRLIFGGGNDLIPLPDMSEVQKESYRNFLQEDVAPEDRKSIGLQELLDEISPIKNHDGSFWMEFCGYTIEKSDVDPEVARRDAQDHERTWTRKVNVNVKLHNERTQQVRPAVSLFLGDFPVMTDRGTFIINGTERVVVNQLSRSPGVNFKAEAGVSGETEYSAKIIPERGAWVEFIMTGDTLTVNIDSRRKMPATLLLKAFGLGSNAELLRAFGGEIEDVDVLINDDSGKKLALGRVLAENITDSYGQVVVASEQRLDEDRINAIDDLGRSTVKVWKVDSVFLSSVEKDQTNSVDEALLEIQRKMKPNDPVRIESAHEHFDQLFTDRRRYTLGRVGRYKMNRRLGVNLPEDETLLTLRDLVRIVKGLVALRDTENKVDLEQRAFPEIGDEHTDDIDHLGNRRIRSIGELLQTQLHIGMQRVERIAIERMNTAPDLSELQADKLLNNRPLQSNLREFFTSGQLSQFMDQVNPLSELTHRRRLTALGPGGLSRERAGFEARDVHYTHYSRICPIETPEGPNIGLVTSLATYARLNEYGFLITPRRPVKDGYVSLDPKGIVYLSADEEENYYVGRANTPFDKTTGKLLEDTVYARYKGEIKSVDPQQVNYLDVSSKQVVSPSAALIPFVEHDDAQRALMGSNMQRQAVPLLLPEAPFVGTGIEERVARDSGCCIYSTCSGTVRSVDAERIVVIDDNGAEVRWRLDKFKRSNQGTIIHQRPRVSAGERVLPGQLLADGQSCDGGELALGRNVLIAFVPWEGYNFEDAVLLSEKLVKEDYFSSIHIEVHDIERREMKMGSGSDKKNEEFTSELPNVEQKLRDKLDSHGIIRIGTFVKPGDILVGKTTPKGESENTPEEKLLRAIFGDKANEVRDTSLRLPHGTWGKVIDVKILSKENGDQLPAGVLEKVKVYVAQWRKITVGDKMSGRHGNKGVVSRILPVEDMPYLPDGTPVDVCLNPLGVPSRMNLGQVLEVLLGFVAMNNGWHVGTPVFEGATDEEIYQMLADVAKRDPNLDGKLSDGGTIQLRDGRTGDLMAKPSTVGVMYMLKLNHLVDDKLHARSVGTYSLITQQPLGGKAQFGGQRFGEMEVWALQGYGAAHVLQEMLTVKSDDIRGRLKTYEKIIKGQNLSKPGIPESFKVLVKELEGLGLAVDIKYPDKNSPEGYTYGPLRIDDDDGPRSPRDIDNISSKDINTWDGPVVQPTPQHDETPAEESENDDFTNQDVEPDFASDGTDAEPATGDSDMSDDDAADSFAGELKKDLLDDVDEPLPEDDLDADELGDFSDRNDDDLGDLSE